MKEETENSYNIAINRVVDYINSHLSEDLTVSKLAAQACISSFYFHRIFTSVIGEPVGAYITRLRLEMAAQQLGIPRPNLSDIAYNCGYNSKYALSKAFKKQFGVSPSVFRKNPPAYSKIKGKHSFVPVTLHPVTEVCNTLHLAYVRITGRYGDKIKFAQGWEKLKTYMHDNNLLLPTTRWIGISFDSPHITDYTRCRFYACATVPHPIKPQGAVGYYNIMAGKFAVFTLKGSYNGLQNMYDNIYREYDYQLRDDVCFEEYVNNPQYTREENLLTKIYIPIK